ncbi:MAG: LamG domain-containing protein [Kofleriaceae bacterium]
MNYLRASSPRPPSRSSRRHRLAASALCALPSLVAASACGSVEVLFVDAPPNAADAPVAVPGLLAWYDMASVGPSSTIGDATGHGHHGRCGSNCPAVAVGKLGGALAFDGRALVHVPSTPELETRRAFTVSAWIFQDPATRDRRRCPINKPLGTGNLNSWAICLEPSGQISFYSAPDPAGPVGDNLTSNQLLTPDAWHHVAITWDGTVKRVFVDGVADGQRPQPIAFDDNDILFGADLDAGLPVVEFYGLLDEVRIYDRALTSAEVSALAL